MVRIGRVVGVLLLVAVVLLQLELTRGHPIHSESEITHCLCKCKDCGDTENGGPTYYITNKHILNLIRSHKFREEQDGVVIYEGVKDENDRNKERLEPEQNESVGNSKEDTESNQSREDDEEDVTIFDDWDVSVNSRERSPGKGGNNKDDNESTYSCEYDTTESGDDSKYEGNSKNDEEYEPTHSTEEDCSADSETNTSENSFEPPEDQIYRVDIYSEDIGEGDDSKATSTGDDGTEEDGEESFSEEIISTEGTESESRNTDPASADDSGDVSPDRPSNESEDEPKDILETNWDPMGEADHDTEPNFTKEETEGESEAETDPSSSDNCDEDSDSPEDSGDTDADKFSKNLEEDTTDMNDSLLQSTEEVEDDYEVTATEEESENLSEGDQSNTEEETDLSTSSNSEGEPDTPEDTKDAKSEECSDTLGDQTPDSLPRSTDEAEDEREVSTTEDDLSEGDSTTTEEEDDISLSSDYEENSKSPEDSENTKSEEFPETLEDLTPDNNDSDPQSTEEVEDDSEPITSKEDSENPRDTDPNATEEETNLPSSFISEEDTKSQEVTKAKKSEKCSESVENQTPDINDSLLHSTEEVQDESGLSAPQDGGENKSEEEEADFFVSSNSEEDPKSPEDSRRTDSHELSEKIVDHTLDLIESLLHSSEEADGESEATEEEDTENQSEGGSSTPEKESDPFASFNSEEGPQSSEDSGDTNPDELTESIVDHTLDIIESLLHSTEDSENDSDDVSTSEEGCEDKSVEDSMTKEEETNLSTTFSSEEDSPEDTSSPLSSEDFEDDALDISGLFPESSDSLEYGRGGFSMEEDSGEETEEDLSIENLKSHLSSLLKPDQDPVSPGDAIGTSFDESTTSSENHPRENPTKPCESSDHEAAPISTEENTEEDANIPSDENQFMVKLFIDNSYLEDSGEDSHPSEDSEVVSPDPSLNSHEELSHDDSNERMDDVTSPTSPEEDVMSSESDYYGPRDDFSDFEDEESLSSAELDEMPQTSSQNANAHFGEPLSDSNPVSHSQTLEAGDYSSSYLDSNESGGDRSSEPPCDTLTGLHDPNNGPFVSYGDDTSSGVEEEGDPDEGIFWSEAVRLQGGTSQRTGSGTPEQLSLGEGTVGATPRGGSEEYVPLARHSPPEKKDHHRSSVRQQYVPVIVERFRHPPNNVYNYLSRFNGHEYNPHPISLRPPRPVHYYLEPRPEPKILYGPNVDHSVYPFARSYAPHPVHMKARQYDSGQGLGIIATAEEPKVIAAGWRKPHPIHYGPTHPSLCSCYSLPFRRNNYPPYIYH